MVKAYIDCPTGISGDMLLGAAVDVGVKEEFLKEKLSCLPFRNWDLTFKKVRRQGIIATKAEVNLTEDKKERTFKELQQIIDKSALDDTIKGKALVILKRLAEVEAKIHDQKIEEVHLHEVGGLDTIIDIVGVVTAFNLLNLSEVVFSPLPLGRGFVDTAHGRLPLPAPATLALLKDVPVYGLDIEAELVTPTGAVLASTLANGFGSFPPLNGYAIGYGAGEKDLSPYPNVLRLLIEKEDREKWWQEEEILTIECTIDDSLPEWQPYLIELLLKNGAQDAFLETVQMKKGRIGFKLTVLAPFSQKEKLISLIFKHSTTLGLRLKQEKKVALRRKTITVELFSCPVNVKIGYFDRKGKEEIVNMACEYEDCLLVSKKTGKPLKEIYFLAQKRAEQLINL